MPVILQEKDCTGSGDGSVTNLFHVEAMDLCSTPRTHLKEPGVEVSACRLNAGETAETGESWGSLNSLSG